MPGVRLVRFLKCTKQMGLHIHSLGQLPATAERAYYVYLLDYGWHEPLGAAGRGADAAEQDAEHVAGEARVVGQEGADPLRQGEHPLGDGQRRQDVVDEVGGHLHLAAGVAGGADSAALAGEGHQPLGGARVAAESVS